MAGLTDIKNNLPPLKRKNGITHSTNVVQMCLFLLILAMIVALLFSGCKPRKVLVERETHYKETFKDTTIYLPGETVTQPLSEDFLKQLESRFKSGLKDTVKIISRTGTTELQFYTDRFGQLQAACESKDRQIDLLLKTIEKFETQTNTVIKEKQVMAWWAWLFVAANIALLISLILAALRN